MIEEKRQCKFHMKITGQTASDIFKKDSVQLNIVVSEEEKEVKSNPENYSGIYREIAELLGDVVWDTKTNLNKRMNAESGACADKMRIAKRAKELGLTVILNPAPANKDIIPYLDFVDILTPNENECELLGGIEKLLKPENFSSHLVHCHMRHIFRNH